MFKHLTSDKKNNEMVNKVKEKSSSVNDVHVLSSQLKKEASYLSAAVLSFVFRALLRSSKLLPGKLTTLPAKNPNIIWTRLNNFQKPTHLHTKHNRCIRD